MAMALDDATPSAIMIALAELIWRFQRIYMEYLFFRKHYPNKRILRTVLLYGFSFSKSSYFLLTIIAAVVYSRYRTLSMVYEDFVDYVYLLPIWWVFRSCRFTESTFDYSDWVRSNSGLDYATGMASSYFHGYLNLVLPGICERIEQYENMHRVEFAVKRLFILIPNSLHSRPVIKSHIMHRENKLGDLRLNRAGVSRPYTNDVYRIKIDGETYYITVEGATPLLSYYESQNSLLTSTWQIKAMQKEIMLKFYKYLKKLLEKCPDTQQQCELLFYNDYTADGEQQDVGEVLRLRIKQIWGNNCMLDKNSTSCAIACPNA